MDEESEKLTDEKIPALALIAILVTAFFLIEVSVGEVVSLIAELVFKIELEEPPHLLNVIFFPVAVGLIIRQSKKRGCAFWLMGIPFVVAIFIGPVLIAQEVQLDNSIEWIFVLQTFGIVLFLGASWWSIKRYASYFDPNQTDRVKQLNRVLVWVFVLISILYQSNEIYAYQNRIYDLDTVFALETDIYVFDEVTKKPLAKMGNFIRSSFGNHPRCDVWKG